MNRIKQYYDTHAFKEAALGYAEYEPVGDFYRGAGKTAPEPNPEISEEAWGGGFATGVVTAASIGAVVWLLAIVGAIEVGKRILGME